MTISVANVDTSQSFGAWLAITNKMARLFTSNTVTTDSTTGGSLTTGNAYVNGYLGANYLYANSALIGGNVSTNAALTVVANVLFQYASANVFVITGNTSGTNVGSYANNILMAPSGNLQVQGVYFNVNAITTNITSASIYANTNLMLTGNSTFNANNSYAIFQVTGNNTITQVVANTTNTTITGNVYLSNTLSVANATTLSNTLSVAGNVSIANAISVSNSANLLYTLSVGGAANLLSTVGVSGAANLLSTVGITGAVNTFSTVGISGAANVLSTLGVTGATTLLSTLAVSGNTTLSSNVVISGATTNAIALNLTGLANLSSNANVGGNLAVGGNLSVTGTSSYTGNAAFTYISSSGNASLSSNSLFTNTSAVVVTGNLVVTSNFANLTGTINFSNASVTHVVNGSLVVNGAITVQSLTANNISFTGTSTASIIPGPNIAYDIGNTSLVWRTGYFNAVNAVSSVYTNTITAYSVSTTSGVNIAGSANTYSVLPLSNTTYSLGNTTSWWSTAYAANVFANNISVANAATISALTTTAVANLSANVAVGGYLQLGNTTSQFAYQIANTYTFTNSTSPANVDSFSPTAFRSAEYLIQVADSTVPAQQVTKILLIHDGTNPYLSEYGTVYSNASFGSLGSFNVGISGNCYLQFSPTSANCVVRILRTGFAV